MPEELLRKPEEKKETPLADDLSSTVVFDEKKFRDLISLRREKLESIKTDIQLKTYHLIAEKIDAEEKTLDKILSEKKQTLPKKANAAGILSPIFFELKNLKAKSIRID